MINCIKIENANRKNAGYKGHSNIQIVFLFVHVIR